MLTMWEQVCQLFEDLCGCLPTNNAVFVAVMCLQVVLCCVGGGSSVHKALLGAQIHQRPQP